MVWELAPLNSSSGATRCYFTSNGIYTVGRKGCAVTILTDKTISRVHAEIIVEAASPYNNLQGFTDIPPPEIRLKDVSKFGTFVNKEVGSKPVFSLPNKETVLNNGDLITFGTTNTIFRLSFIPFLFCITAIEDLDLKHRVHNTVSSIGAYSIEKWKSNCTHLIVEDSSPITNDVLDAVVAKKPIVVCNWIQDMMGQASSLSEIPNCSSFGPTLMLKQGPVSIPVKIVDSKFRETCLSGFTFMVGPSDSYHYKERLKLLLEVCGATVIPVAKKNESIQKADIPVEREFLVFPAEDAKKNSGLGPDQFSYMKKIPRLDEYKVIEIVLSGEFNASSFKPPLSPVSSSRTEETVDVADSEDEVEVTTSHQFSKVIESRWSSLKRYGTDISPISGERQILSDADETRRFKSVPEVNSTQLFLTRSLGESSVNQTVMQFRTVTGDKEFLSAGRKTVEIVNQKTKELANNSEAREETTMHIKREERDVSTDKQDFQKPDIIYDKNLIVRKDGECRNEKITLKADIPNFKCFRKKNAVSGNSFNDLIPFARDPYKESDYAREMAEYIREEKMRKEAEALAEDLFNADRVKRQRGTTGTSFLESQTFSRQRVR
ncbi:nibrin homolog isoform X1 [Cryptomeria japonica]|uniref:nibrin homolog isoform X1 n=1 Tax=Cryptomeria japonica TaxID=3369 RepID=UPI0027DA8152|nr:nibrin homolog isoform X1 [Cryptomeria japonica]